MTKYNKNGYSYSICLVKSDRLPPIQQQQKVVRDHNFWMKVVQEHNFWTKSCALAHLLCVRRVHDSHNFFPAKTISMLNFFHAKKTISIFEFLKSVPFWGPPFWASRSLQNCGDAQSCMDGRFDSVKRLWSFVPIFLGAHEPDRPPVTVLYKCPRRPGVRRWPHR